MRHVHYALVATALAACTHGAGKATDAGCDFEAQIAEELAVISEGERTAATIEEAEWTPAQRVLIERASVLLDARDRPVSPQDIALLDRALALIENERTWDRADDRQCVVTDTSFSLFCALQRASVEVLGAYQHRRTALQEVRFALEEATVGREYEHRLRDFNNDPATSLEDVRNVILVARERVIARLSAQSGVCR